MARSVSLLAGCSPIAVLVAFFALSAGASAQNYVPAETFSGPNVVIDFGTLDQASALPNQWAVAPVLQEPLSAPTPPPKLTPPPARQAMRMTPVSPAPMPTSQPTIMPDSAPMAPEPRSAGMPSAPLVANKSATVALPKPDNFSVLEMPGQIAPVAQRVPVAPTNNPPRNTGSMLNQARSGNTSGAGQRVNLASMSDGPPMAMRNTEPTVSKPVTAAKPAAIAKPSAPLIAARPSAPPPAPALAAMPATNSLSDLDNDKTTQGDMADVIQQATKPPAPAKPSSRPADDMTGTQMASLPPTVQPITPAIDHKPTVSAESAEQTSLSFAQGAGELDSASKKSLDKVIAALKADTTARAQIRAYASGTPETSGQARRLSLTRALAARTYIIDQDIPATRLDIRALGNGQGTLDKPDTANMDRIDISLVK